MREHIAKVLIEEASLKRRVAELGQAITEDYQGKDLVIIGILKGAILFLSDLIQSIDLPLVMDFMAVSSYGASTKSSGIVRILKDLDEEIAGKDVLIVEDIVDTGLTLQYLLENLRTRHPRSLRICAFLDKPSRRTAQISVDYVGFEIPDEFVVGYGLDFAEKYRNLPFVGVLAKEAYEK